MKKLLPILILCILVQSCAGVIVKWPKDQTIVNPFISEERDYTWVRNIHCSECGCESGNYTVAWLEDNWGKPASIEIASSNTGGAIWTYTFERRWCGMIAIVVLPVPLLVPIGRYEVQFLVKEDHIISAKKVGAYAVGGALGIIGPDGPFRFATAGEW